MAIHFLVVITAFISFNPNLRCSRMVIFFLKVSRFKVIKTNENSIKSTRNTRICNTLSQTRLLIVKFALYLFWLCVEMLISWLLEQVLPV